MSAVAVKCWLEVLLADHRVIRARPSDEAGVETERTRRAQATCDLALRNVKQRTLNNRFKGIIRATGAFRRLRLRAARRAGGVHSGRGGVRGGGGELQRGGGKQLRAMKWRRCHYM